MKETLEFPEVGRFYLTRSGSRAFVASDVGTNPFRDRIDLYPLIGYVEGLQRVCSWSIDGRIEKGVDRSLDLVREIPCPKPITGWVNIYPGGERCCRTDGLIYATKVDADNAAGAERLACIEIDAILGSGLDEAEQQYWIDNLNNSERIVRRIHDVKGPATTDQEGRR